MSEVISFRLDPKNPREAQAMAVLQNRQEKGYRTRDILTWALLQQDELEYLHELMYGFGEQLQKLSLKLDRLSSNEFDKSSFLGATSDLSDDFKTAIRKKVKQGLKV